MEAGMMAAVVFYLYVGSHEIPKVLGGYGVNIVSTSKGLMSGKTARRENMGGELLAQIY